MTLIVHTQARNAEKVLEIGCGPGLHSLTLIQSMMKNKSTLIATDYCPKMLQLVEKTVKEKSHFKEVQISNKKNENLKDQYLNQQKNTKHMQNLNPESTQDFNSNNQDTTDFSNNVEFHDETFDKKLILQLQDAQNLTISSQSIDVYLANLSLMLVDDPLKQIKECYRVLKPRGQAGFTVWGRKCNSPVFNIFEEALNQVLFPENSTKPASMSQEKHQMIHLFTKEFEFGHSIDKIEQLFLEGGFTDIQMWYQTQNYVFEDSDDYWNFISKLQRQKEYIEKLDNYQKYQLQSILKKC
eukprot:403354621